MTKMFTGSGKMFQEVQILPLDDEALGDVERRIKVQPHFLGEPLVVIGEAIDFPQVLGQTTHDLLALDTMGRTIAISLCVGVADTDADTHALQLAAYVASLTPEDLGKIARSFISRPANDSLRRSWEEMGVEISAEAVELTSLLAATFSRDAADYADLINAEQRIMIASEDFTSRLVNVIQWLVEGGIGVTGLRYRKYLVGGQEVYFAEQIIPRVDPAVDAPDHGAIRKPAETAEPWRAKGRIWHVERLTPTIGSRLDELLVMMRPSTFTINWSNKYYFWVRGSRRNLRIRTYFRDRLEIGFYNAAASSVETFLAQHDLPMEVTTVGGYSDSPFVSIVHDTVIDERWSRMLNDWLSGKGGREIPSERRGEAKTASPQGTL